jgi:hypothetical protein
VNHSDPGKRSKDAPEKPADRPGPAKPSQSGYGHDSEPATREEGAEQPTTPNKARDPKRPL